MAADTLGDMLDLLVHYGALVLFVAIVLYGATARAIRDYRREERGERISITAD